jgi:murein DD-endopeptidase MepM/ murein hydrolase activator NlpD
VDILAPEGTPVRAARDGIVVYSDNQLSGYGNLVIIDHGNNLATVYGHNSVNLVRLGASVRRGTVIARVGQTGNASTPHLHFEVRRGQTPVDPLPYLR